MQEEIKNFLAQWSATGLAGGLAIHFYTSNERTLALLSAIVTTLTALWATFSKGFMGEMDKIVDQAGKSFAQWLARWLPKTIQESWQKILFKHQYYQYLTGLYYSSRPEGLITQSPFSPDLEKIFIPLQISPTYTMETGQPLIPKNSQFSQGGVSHTQPPQTEVSDQKPNEELEIWHFLALCQDQPAYKHMVIIAGPGSGKSTLLKHLTLTYAQNKECQYNRKSPTLVPVLLLLRNISDVVVSEQPPNLAQLVTESLYKEKLKPPLKWFEEKLQKGKCLVLLDGMDEVADTEKRKKVRDWIDEQIHHNRESVFIVTSRPLGYQNAQLKESTACIKAKPFNLKQIKKFVHSWYLQNTLLTEGRKKEDQGVKIRAEKQANDLINSLIEHQAILDLSQNPLLLTMIASLHSSGQVLPKSRVVLYEEICYVLLGRRRESKGLPDLFGLTRDQKLSILQVLAFELKCRKIREFSLSEGISIIEKELKNIAGDRVTPKDFIKYIESDSSIVVEVEEEIYDFAHLSFQDYLTAVEIKEKNQEKILIDNINNDWWAEVIRLYAPKNDTTSIIQSVLAQENPTDLSLILAFDCLDEGKRVKPEVREQLESKLNEDLESSDPTISNRAGKVTLSRRTRITSNGI